jgi:predicted permease
MKKYTNFISLFLLGVGTVGEIMFFIAVFAMNNIRDGYVILLCSIFCFGMGLLIRLNKKNKEISKRTVKTIFFPLILSLMLPLPLSLLGLNIPEWLECGIPTIIGTSGLIYISLD